MLPEKHIPALILIDVQNAIDDPVWGARNNPGAEDKLRHLLDAWRDAGASVYHVRHDSPEPQSPYRPGQPGNDFKPEAAPIAGEPIIAKTTNSAFIRTDFEERLRRSGHNSVVMAGVLASNSLEMSVRHAGNLGFDVCVVSDASWDVDTTDLHGRIWSAADVHALCLARINGEYARVISAAQAMEYVR